MGVLDFFFYFGGVFFAFLKFLFINETVRFENLSSEDSYRSELRKEDIRDFKGIITEKEVEKRNEGKEEEEEDDSTLKYFSKWSTMLNDYNIQFQNIKKLLSNYTVGKHKENEVNLKKEISQLVDSTERIFQLLACIVSLNREKLEILDPSIKILSILISIIKKSKKRIKMPPRFFNSENYSYIKRLIIETPMLRDFCQTLYESNSFWVVILSSVPIFCGILGIKYGLITSIGFLFVSGWVRNIGKEVSSISFRSQSVPQMQKAVDFLKNQTSNEYKTILLKLSELLELTERAVSVEENLQKENCSICFEPLIEQKIARPNKCNHFFHSNCLERWMDHNEIPTCPICREIFERPAIV